MELTVLVVCFLVMMVIGVPIAYNLIISSFAYIMVSDFLCQDRKSVV